MKKIFNLISSIFFVGLPIISSSCSTPQLQEEPIINLNDYALSDNEYVFRTSITQNSRGSWEEIDNGNSITYLPYLFSSWVFIDDFSSPKYQDKKSMLNNIKEYYKFSEPINSENVYSASLFLNQRGTEFLDLWELITNTRFANVIAWGLFKNNSRDFYLNRGFHKNVVDKFMNEDLYYSYAKFYNFDNKENYINLLRSSDFRSLSKSLVENKNIENNEVWVTIDYNFTFSEPDFYEQSLRIKYAPNPNSDFTWHNGSKNPIVFWFDLNAY